MASRDGFHFPAVRAAIPIGAIAYPHMRKSSLPSSRNLHLLETSSVQSAKRTFEPLSPVVPSLSEGYGQVFRVEPGAKLFTDSDASITEVAPELKRLTGIRISREEVRKA
jgi:hypothetical protein